MILCIYCIDEATAESEAVIKLRCDAKEGKQLQSHSPYDQAKSYTAMYRHLPRFQWLEVQNSQCWFHVSDWG